MFQWFGFFLLVLCLDGMQNQMTLAYFAADITICITTTFTLSTLRGFLCHAVYREQSYPNSFLISLNHFTIKNTLVCVSPGNVTPSHCYLESSQPIKGTTINMLIIERRVRNKRR